MKVSFVDRVRYRFDNFMSRGTIALVAALFAATLCMILTAATVLVLLGLWRVGDTTGMSLPEAIWQVAMHTIDTGNVAGDTGWSARAVGFLVTLGGIFITSALIGILATGLEGRFSELRRGRSRVLESGHTIVLGWSPQVFTIINELALANRSLSRRKRNANAERDAPRSACVVILADRDKLEMEEEIHTKVPDTRGTRIVCRSGNPLDPDDLEIVSPETARAIVILSLGGQYPDLSSAKTLLALTRNRERHAHPYHMVTVVQRPTNLEIFQTIGGDEAQVFMVDRLISLVIAQTCRQPGLAAVYSELFSFENAAIYFAEIPELVSCTYGEALSRFENTTLIGLQSRAGTSLLNPPAGTLIQPEDKVIAIADDDDTIRLSSLTNPAIDPAGFSNVSTPSVSLDRLLILGWNRRAPMILAELGHVTTTESHITVLASQPVEQMKSDCSGAKYESLQITFEQGNPADRPTLEKLLDSGIRLVMILSPTDSPDIQISDAATMVSLLQLRAIAGKSGRKLSIVTEIMDPRNRALVKVTSAEDVIIGDQLIALAMTQLAENRDIASVFVQLLTADQKQMELKPVGDYIQPGGQVNFHTIVASALRKGETAIGYRLVSEASQAEQSFGVHINPEKSKLIPFCDLDQVIVLANAG
jgi:ion channel POLLUX/CASTOR